MTFYDFRGYGFNAPNVTIILERITHFFPIDYNGRRGTEIVLDTGKSVRVDYSDYDVRCIVSQVTKP